MSAIQIFDPALCCSSGVCGTQVEQALVTFAADLAWAKEQGVAIERFNLAQQPMQFADAGQLLGASHTIGQYQHLMQRVAKRSQITLGFQIGGIL